MISKKKFTSLILGMTAMQVIGIVAVPAVMGCAAALPIAEAIVPVIDGAICAVEATQPNEPGWVSFLCTVTGNGSQPGSLSGLRPTMQIRVRVPKAEAAAFLKAHSLPPTDAASPSGG
jgi:hypothetical protein